MFFCRCKPTYEGLKTGAEEDLVGLEVPLQAYL